MATIWLSPHCDQREDLPDVCLKCGREATRRVKKSFTWAPGWVWILILAHPIVLLIVYYCIRKTQRIAAPLCEEHKGHWLRRTLFIWAGLFGFVGGGIGLAILANQPGTSREMQDLAPLAVILGILVWIVSALVASKTAIRPVEISPRGIKLWGVHPHFVEVHKEQVGFGRVSLDHSVRDRWESQRGRLADLDRGRRARPDDREEREERDRFRE